MLQVRQRLQKIDENMKLEKDILSNARYEVTYNLEKRQSGVDGPFRKDLTLWSVHESFRVVKKFRVKSKVYKM